MRKKRLLAKVIGKLSEKKKMVVFGAGRNTLTMLSEYKKYIKAEKIYKILDNNPDVIGTVFECDGVSITIENPNVLREMKPEEIFVVVTPNDCKLITNQLRGMCGESLEIWWFTKYSTFFENIFVRMMISLPLKNYIVMNGRDDTNENSLALVNYLMLNKRDKYKFIWSRKKFDSKDNLPQIEWSSNGKYSNCIQKYRCLFYTSRAKYIIYDNRYIRKMRSDQKAIDLDHGAFPLKCVKKIMSPFSDFDMFMATSEFSATAISEQCYFDREKMHITGYPRTDRLFEENRNILINKFNVCEDKTKILWTPTFRELADSNRRDSKSSYKFGIPIITCEEDITLLDEFLEKTQTQIIIKLHAHQDLSYIKAQSTRNIIILTQQDLIETEVNIYDIMNEFDAMITDYSSIAYDFMLLDRPIVYTIDDIDDYTIGFSVQNPFEFMPGEKVKNMDEFKTAIMNIANGIDAYKDERKKVNDLINTYQDGQSCKRVCDAIGL